jgi:hypothetical protein
VELIVLVVLFGLMVALFLSALRPAKKGHQRTCDTNLSQLTKAMYHYSITKSPIEGQFPSHRTGGAFWLVLYETGELDDPSLFTCPVLGTTPADGKHTDYRGPKGDPNTALAGRALGCDKPGNHGGDPKVSMNWVALSGDVHKVPADAAKWGEVLRDTQD